MAGLDRVSPKVGRTTGVLDPGGRPALFGLEVVSGRDRYAEEAGTRRCADESVEAPSEG